MTTAFLKDRITAVQAQIVALEAAMLALATGAIQSYSLDTGQTRQLVTKLDLDMLNRVLDSMYNRCVTLEARLTGGNSVTVRPSF